MGYIVKKIYENDHSVQIWNGNISFSHGSMGK